SGQRIHGRFSPQDQNRGGPRRRPGNAGGGGHRQSRQDGKDRRRESFRQFHRECDSHSHRGNRRAGGLNFLAPRDTPARGRITPSLMNFSSEQNGLAAKTDRTALISS